MPTFRVRHQEPRWEHTTNSLRSLRVTHLLSRSISDLWVSSLKQKPKRKWAQPLPISTSSQKFWRARSRNGTTSSIWVMGSRKSSQRTLKTSKWLSPSLDTEATDAAIDRRTSSARASGRAPSRARNCREICKFRTPSPNDDHRPLNSYKLNEEADSYLIQTKEKFENLKIQTSFSHLFTTVKLLFT